MQSYTDALNNMTSFNFSTDGKNNLTSVTDGSGSVTSFGYSNTSHPYYPSSLTNPQGKQTTFGYDPQGNLNAATDTTSGTTVSRVYNANGTGASAKDGNGNTTTYGYDAAGNLITVTPPSPLAQVTLTVDNVSRVTSVTSQPSGNIQTTSFTYDALDRVTDISYDKGAKVDYSYDANGNVVTFSDNTGATLFTYDAVNQQVKKTLPNGTVISAGYDPVGNLTSVTDPGGTVNYSYDKVNLLATLTEPGGLQTTYSYDTAYKRIKEVYPNGVTISTGYNGAGALTSITGQNASGTLTSFTYSYNKDLRQSVTDQSGTKTNYGFDSLDRLTSAKVYNSGGTQTNEYDYGYDGAGNRTSSKSGLNGTTISYHYNGANELTSSSVVASYSYDGNGNLTGSSGGPNLQYNTMNQTASIGNTNFTYTGPDQNERVQVDNTNFTYSGLGLNSMSDSSGTTYFTRDNSGGLVDERTPSGRYYYLFDGLGSVVGLSDSSGNLVGGYQYDPYGTLTNTPGSTALKNNPWRFASGFFDSSTGLYKFGVRYYDPSLGRWTQQDPVGGSLAPSAGNRYTYANDDPVNGVDPSGGQNVSAWCAGAAATAAVGFLLLTILPLITGGAALPLIWFALVVTVQSPEFLVTVGIACIGGVVGSWVAAIVQQATS